MPPSNHLALAGADIIFNLSASNELIGKANYLRNLVVNQSARLIAGYVYAGCGYGESTQDLVFSGRAYIAEMAHCLPKENDLLCTSKWWLAKSMWSVYVPNVV